jgi:hypothetical protein
VTLREIISTNTRKLYINGKDLCGCVFLSLYFVSDIDPLIPSLTSSLHHPSKMAEKQDERALTPTLSTEKQQQITREYLQQDETPESIEERKKEVALVRKLDCFVAPVMMLLMLISYLDRGNIGFAATQGMTKAIDLKGSELNVC